MINERTLEKNITKSTIDGNEFIRVANFDTNNDIINMYLYLKVNNRYKKVAPTELPYSLMNKLNIDSNFTKMNEDEIKEFLNILEESNKLIPECNTFIPLEFLDLGYTLDINYSLTKEAKSPFYALNSFRLNEFLIMTDTSTIPFVELPYVLVDILGKHKNLSNSIILLENNLFVKLYKDNEKIFCCIFYLEENMIRSLGNFKIINENDKFEIVTNLEDKLFKDELDEKIDTIVDEALNQLGLTRIENPDEAKTE